MLRIATDPRCSASLDAIRDRWTILDVLDVIEVLDILDSLEGGD